MEDTPANYGSGGQSLDFIRGKLNAWGQWLIDCDVGLGHRYIEQSPTSRDVTYDPDECARMDKILCSVKKCDARVFQTLKRYYYFRESTTQAAINLKTTVPTFRTWKQKGEFTCFVLWNE